MTDHYATKAEKCIAEINEILKRYDLELSALDENSLEITDGYVELQPSDNTSEAARIERIRRFRQEWAARHKSNRASARYDVCNALVQIYSSREDPRGPKLLRRLQDWYLVRRREEANNATLRTAAREALKRDNPELYAELFGGVT